MTINTTAIPAGWYRDPAGSTAARWWDGAQWTERLRQPEPPDPPVAPAIAPAVQAMQPVQPTFQPIQPVQPMQYAPASQFSAVPHNNSIAWFALIAGIVAIVAILAREAFPSGSFYLPVFGLTATIAGIRGIYRYRRGRVTVLWAPIVGLVLGVIAEILLISSIVLASTGIAALSPRATLGPTGASINYDMGSGSLQYLPTANGTLSQAATAESDIVSALQADYANGKTGVAADGSWPTALLHTASGDVTTSDGRNLGDMINPGWNLAYQVNQDGSFTIGVSGPDTSELAVYNSVGNEYLAWCQASDQTCKTSSPVAPITQGGSTQSTTT